MCAFTYSVYKNYKRDDLNIIIFFYVTEIKRIDGYLDTTVCAHKETNYRILSDVSNYTRWCSLHGIQGVFLIMSNIQYIIMINMIILLWKLKSFWAQKVDTQLPYLIWPKYTFTYTNNCVVNWQNYNPCAIFFWIIGFRYGRFAH